MSEEVPAGVIPLARAVTAAVILMEEDDADAFQLVMNVANIAALEWMVWDGDEEIRLEQLAKWQHVTVNIEDYHTFRDYSFKLHFRMSRAVFQILVETVGNHLVERGRLVRRRTPLQDILLMVIWIMATPDTFRSVALRELADRFISWPNEHERDQISGAFQRVSGLPGVVGCIDGTHIYVPKPVEDGAQYRNRHHTYSLNVQAVVDNNLLVRDLYVGEVGSMTDCRVFRRSDLCRDLVLGANNRLDVNNEHLIGDGGYTLTDFMLISFANNGHLTPAQIEFNRRLSQCRVRVENAFGRAKGKWRRLKMLPARNRDIIVDHIVSSFVLHNFTVLNGEQLLLEEELGRPINDNQVLGNEDFENENIEDEEDEDYDALLDAAQGRGQEKRIFLMNQLAHF
ncbi:Protein ANTAGONIST OF LIKE HETEROCHROMATIN PROTEIN 1 [Frankliniella fusca]|uniref:Protein ANTAGONIST OF LIKE HETEROCHROMATIN PROTEIN 1 n=1 Tax=Frankliniella fusca TaxID=407009 RepID=A0AAE1HPY9_9NEOP|nr:Protein ANTAGONIST OF LIKE HETEROCHROMATIN PROTEIN 1 [Frankliniella fusca]